MAVLRCLIRHHGLTTVFVEGISQDRKALPVLLQSVQKKAEYEKQLRQQGQTVEEMRGDAKAEQLLVEIDDLLEQARREQLEAGAAIRLVASGELKEVLPLDDEAARDAANPVKNGRIEQDLVKINERRDAIVRNAMKQRVAVIILGGSHNLTENADRISQRQCTYLQVTTKEYPGD